MKRKCNDEEAEFEYFLKEFFNHRKNGYWMDASSGFNEVNKMEIFMSYKERRLRNL